jgi:cyclopropane-fatty-acyl-phospholipid synthase
MPQANTMTLVGINPLSLLERLARKLVLKSLASLKYGQLNISEGNQVWTFGTHKDQEPHATIRIERACMWDRVAFGGTVGAAESYMDSDWSSDNLVDVVRIFCGNREMMSGFEGGLALLKWPFLQAYHALRRDTIAGSRKNISAHYDLGNDFFAAWLDPSMTYSSGIFPSSDASMLSASILKIQTLCDKLHLKPTDHLLEIGSGWGALAFFAASNFGCKVTTVTISQNQYNFVRSEAKKLGLQDKIDVQFLDYRNITGSFDKIVSVEMIEAVGHHYFDTFFEKVSKLLKPDGLAVIQAITIRDQYYEEAIRNVDFIQRYIFPGSTIPSIARMMESVKDATDMTLEGLEDFTPHYAKTLEKWREAFWKSEGSLKTMGCSESMMRMWDFYFAYCQGGFTEHVIGVVQMVLSKPKFKQKS